METSIQGTFVARGYTGMVAQDTEQSLAEILRSQYPDGSIVKLYVSCELIGSLPLCQDRTRYGLCRSVLDQDGICPNSETHKVKEENGEMAVR